MSSQNTSPEILDNIPRPMTQRVRVLNVAMEYLATVVPAESNAGNAAHGAFDTAKTARQTESVAASFIGATQPEPQPSPEKKVASFVVENQANDTDAARMLVNEALTPGVNYHDN